MVVIVCGGIVIGMMNIFILSRSVKINVGICEGSIVLISVVGVRILIVLCVGISLRRHGIAVVVD